MNADAMATRLSVLGRALPMRVLVVEDDANELARCAERLEDAGFEVERAANGEQALQHLDRQWFPLLVTDWHMPVMDGLALTQTLRARGVTDTYIIMLTAGESGEDYERGYLCGVDDYLIKQLPDAELFARVHVAFSTLALRRSLQEAHNALSSGGPVDAASGAFSSEELRIRLNAELRRAQRYGRQLTVLTVGLDPTAAANAAKPDFLRRVVQTMQSAIRTHVDWIGRLATAAPQVSFAVVLPEAGAADGPGIKSRLNAVLAKLAATDPAASGFDFGLASLDRGGGDGKIVEVEDMLGVAEQCRACPGRTGPAQLSTVQRSVATHVAIACRHGYAVDSNCHLKLSIPPPSSDPVDRTGVQARRA
ncbi:MAG TPA: response regulator [Steroidobacteraceae bacterium]|jgi:DNA-binding response OmpR family regulator